MPDLSSKNEREVGRIIAVSNYRVTVLLDSEVRSQIRSFPHQISVITQIGGYLLFPVSPGESAVGITVWASENEMVEPDEQTGMTLQLGRARRILKLNLIGQLREEQPFKPGVSVYPNLDTAALMPTHQELNLILEYQPPKKQDEVDTPLPVGYSSVYTGQGVTCSFNDILSRPLGIIGNTGSGKSWSVASLIQTSLAKLREKESNKSTANPRFIILDINGEYKNAFPTKASNEESKRDLNEVYINNKPFNLPLWAFNLNELEGYFEASQASQKPVLERVVTTIRESVADPSGGDKLRGILRETENSKAAIAISALLFSLAHLPNEGVTVLAIAVIAAYGVLQAALYMATRRLWVCIGTHIAWNYCVSQVFSSTVSGHAATDGLLRGELVGDVMLTGGVFGVEASLITLLLIAALAAWWLRRAFARQP